MPRTLPMNDPPIQLEPGCTVDVERFAGHVADGIVVGHEVGQCLVVVGLPVAGLKDHGSFRGVVCDHVGAQARQFILAAQKGRELAEQLQAFVRIVGPPHRCFQAGNFVGLELAKAVGARSIEVVRRVRDTGTGDDSGDSDCFTGDCHTRSYVNRGHPDERADGRRSRKPARAAKCYGRGGSDGSFREAFAARM
jgi:hypothetical protein